MTTSTATEMHHKKRSSRLKQNERLAYFRKERLVSLRNQTRVTEKPSNYRSQSSSP